MSGPAASGTLPGLDGLQLWVKATNAKGGVNGHLVKLFVADDNTDNARERQLTQEFVEQKGVIAFVQNGEALTGSASVDYLKAKGVPDINSIGGNTYFYESPVHFPLVAHGEEFVKASLYNSADYVYTLKKGSIGFRGEPAELDGEDVFSEYLGQSAAEPPVIGQPALKGQP